MNGIGNIIGIEENVVFLKMNPNYKHEKSLVGLYIVFKDSERAMVGEITNIKDSIAYVNLLGEIKKSKFVFGAVHKPSMNSNVALLPEQ